MRSSLEVCEIRIAKYYEILRNDRKIYKNTGRSGGFTLKRVSAVENPCVHPMQESLLFVEEINSIYKW